MEMQTALLMAAMAHKAFAINVGNDLIQGEGTENDTSFVQAGLPVPSRGVFIGAGVCLFLVAVAVAIKKFFKGCWRAIRCRKICRPFACCMRACGKDQFDGFDMNVVLHNLTENKRSTGKFQIRVVHDTKVYKSTESEHGRWNETVSVKIQQGVTDIVLELWHYPIIGSVKKISESYVDIKRDIIDRNYPAQALVQLRKRGMRDCMLCVSFDRPDIIDTKFLQSEKIPVSDELRYRVSKAAVSVPGSPNADATHNEIQALSMVLCGPMKQPIGVLGQMTHGYYAVVHDENKPMHQGWYWARWQSLQAREAGENPEKKVPVTQIIEVKASNNADELAMILAKNGGQKVIMLQAVDRSRAVWIEGIRIFIRKLFEMAKKENRRSQAEDMINESGLNSAAAAAADDKQDQQRASIASTVTTKKRASVLPKRQSSQMSMTEPSPPASFKRTSTSRGTLTPLASPAAGPHRIPVGFFAPNVTPHMQPNRQMRMSAVNMANTNNRVAAPVKGAPGHNKVSPIVTLARSKDARKPRHQNAPTATKKK